MNRTLLIAVGPSSPRNPAQDRLNVLCRCTSPCTLNYPSNRVSVTHCRVGWHA